MKRRNFWLRFSLRVLLLVIFSICAVLSWLVSAGRVFDAEKQVLEKCGADPSFTFYRNSVDELGELTTERPMLFDASLSWLFGNNPLQRVAAIKIRNNVKLREIDDLSSLRYLRSIEIFDCNRFASVGKLQEFPELVRLQFFGCDGFKSFGFENSAEHLRELRLESCRLIKGLDGLVDLRRLETIVLFDCRALASVAALRSAGKLESCYLIECDNIPEIETIRELQAIKKLTIYGCDGIVDFSPLAGLEGLVDVTLSALPIENVDFMADVQSIENLDLSKNRKLTNVNGLRKLSQIKTIDIRSCPSISKIQVEALQKALPSTTVLSDFGP